jgi:hypothetical protein
MLVDSLTCVHRWFRPACAGDRQGGVKVKVRKPLAPSRRGPSCLHGLVIGAWFQCRHAGRRFRLPSPGESTMSSFALYLIGMIVVIGGLAYVAFLMHVPSQWIVAGAVVLLGLGIVGAVTHTRRRDPPES